MLPIKLRSVDDSSEDWWDLDEAVYVVVNVYVIIFFLGLPHELPGVPRGASRGPRSGRSCAVNGNVEGRHADVQNTIIKVD